MNTIYNILSTSTVNGNNFAVRTFKGNTTIVYNLSTINTNGKIPIRVDANFDDGQTFTRLYDFTSSGTILDEPIVHEFVIKKNFDFNLQSFNAVIKITYSNFITYNYTVPVKIYNESFYSKHKKFNISNCQFLDDTDDSLYVMIENSDGSVFNSVIK